MQEIKQINEKLLKEAMSGLKKGFNQVDFNVMSQVLDNLKDIDELGLADSVKPMAKSVNGDIEGTLIDDNIRAMNTQFVAYMEAKKDYHITMDDVAKKKMLVQLNTFLNSIKDIFKEMHSSSDFNQERDTIKVKLREIFQLYQ